jgi:hypothetical protein
MPVGRFMCHEMRARLLFHGYLEVKTNFYFIYYRLQFAARSEERRRRRQCEAFSYEIFSINLVLGTINIIFGLNPISTTSRHPKRGEEKVLHFICIFGYKVLLCEGDFCHSLSLACRFASSHLVGGLEWEEENVS